MCFAERRPLKPQLPTPLFRSPSARLIQRDTLAADDRGSDGSNLGSLGGSTKEVHHYTFQPSKQIVSKKANKNDIIVCVVCIKDKMRLSFCHFSCFRS